MLPPRNHLDLQPLPPVLNRGRGVEFGPSPPESEEMARICGRLVALLVGSGLLAARGLDWTKARTLLEKAIAAAPSPVDEPLSPLLSAARTELDRARVMCETSPKDSAGK